MADMAEILIPNRALIAATGKDALGLLQKLVTADLEALERQDGAAYTLLLTPQGKYRFDFFVIKAQDALYLDAPAGQAQDLIAALGKYRLRADAQFTLLPEATVLLGEKPTNEILSFRDPRHEALGWRNWQRRTAVQGDAFDYDTRRIRLGIVEPSDDLPAAEAGQGALPLEYGLDRLHAISYGKGCFLGQEATARMHNRDLVKHEVIVLHPHEAEIDGAILAQANGYKLVRVRRDGK